MSRRRKGHWEEEAVNQGQSSKISDRCEKSTNFLWSSCQRPLCDSVTKCRPETCEKSSIKLTHWLKPRQRPVPLRQHKEPRVLDENQDNECANTHFDRSKISGETFPQASITLSQKTERLATPTNGGLAPASSRIGMSRKSQKPRPNTRSHAECPPTLKWQAELRSSFHVFWARAGQIQTRRTYVTTSGHALPASQRTDPGPEGENRDEAEYE